MPKAVIFLCVSMFYLSCAPGYTRLIPSYASTDTTSQPVYSQLSNWAAHPYKRDPSDSIPRPLKNDYSLDSSVDVFFLHPTSFTSRDDSGWNALINDPALNAKTDYTSILYQASIFNQYRVFAPRYRQAHIRSYFTADTITALKAFDLAYQDIREAFSYYLLHYNDGRPIIIASHSQGTTHALRLLKEFFDESELKNRLVSAYLVGMYVPENYFKNLRICDSATQTNCFCGWRTYKVDYIPEYVTKEKVKSSVTNPLSWTTDKNLAERKLNEGAILRKFNKVYYRVSGAQIKDGVLWTNKPKFPGSFMLRTSNYHIGDLNLYYYSIRKNLRQRVIAFKKLNGAG